MGRGEGPLLKKASPPKPAGAARVPSPLEAFRLVGRRPVGVPLDGDGARCNPFHIIIYSSAALALRSGWLYRKNKNQFIHFTFS